MHRSAGCQFAIVGCVLPLSPCLNLLAVPCFCDARVLLLFSAFDSAERGGFVCFHHFTNFLMRPADYFGC